MAAPCKADRCAFFGSDATNGYCSKCFMARFQETPTTTSTTTTPADATNSTSDRTAVLLGEMIASTAALDDLSPGNAASEANDGATSAGAAAEGQPSEEEEAGSSTGTMVETADNTSSQKADSSSHCHFCNKRIRLAEKYDCKCGDVFCSTHRHFKAHSCTFDYKASGREAIAKANPTVKGSKLRKI